MTGSLGVRVIVAASVLLVPGSLAAATCSPLQAASGRRVVAVRSMQELRRAVEGAAPDTTVRVMAGEYRLDRTLDIAVPGTTIEGATGNRADVILHGAGMTERQVGVALSVSAPDVTIANLTISDVGYHGIQVRGERAASRVRIRNVHVADTGQQLVKGSTDGSARRSDDGVIECSLFEYTDHAPSDYTNGVDILAGRRWIVRDNVFRRIRGPVQGNHAAGPAILFWQNAQDTIVERNVVLDSFRGIALGLGPGLSGRTTADGAAAADHEGGTIRSNVVINLNGWADEGVEVNDAPGAAIEDNIVLTDGALPWGISVRFPATVVTVRDNVSTKPVTVRTGGRFTGDGNVSGVSPSEILDASGTVRLSSGQSLRIDPNLLDGLQSEPQGERSDDGRRRH